MHGISDENVADAPGWATVGQEVHKILTAHDNLVVYNAKFDLEMIYSSEKHIGIQRQPWGALITWWCAMHAYAELHGEWNDYHQSFRWVKLADAAYQMNVEMSNAHSALGDCQMTLAVCQALALS